MIKNLKTTVILCSIGTILEWYDFSIFGAMAPIISKLFFPTYDTTTAFLATFIVFSTGFLARPLGGILFGFIGDKFGRKISILTTIFAMTLATVGIGLLPTYNSVGIIAPSMLVLMRIFQGLASSGEHTGSVTYLSEIVTEKKYFLLSFIFTGVLIGTLLGSLMGGLVTFIFEKNSLLQYGWRLPFLFSFILGICGLYFRSKINESPKFRKMKLNNGICSNPTLKVFSNEKSKIALIIGIFCINVVSFYSIFVYLPAKLVHQGICNESMALAINSVSILCMSIITPTIGFLCDKYNGYLFMKIGSIGFILLTYPLFVLIENGNYLLIMMSQCTLGLLNAMFLAPTAFVYTNLFPNNVRYSGVSISMNISAAVFGGFSPLVMAYFEKKTNHTLFQSMYIIAAAILSLGCVTIITQQKFQLKIKYLVEGKMNA